MPHLSSFNPAKQKPPISKPQLLEETQLMEETQPTQQNELL